MVSDGIRFGPAQISQENVAKCAQLRPEVSMQSSARYLSSRSPRTPELMSDAERVQHLQEKKLVWKKWLRVLCAALSFMI